jgi:Protein of unknown function (DUF4013)
VSNPYASPGGYDVPPQKYPPHNFARTEVSYLEAFDFPRTNPNWILNCLLLGLPLVVPMIGQILVQLIGFGYLYGDYEALQKTGQPNPSDVKFEKAGDYIQRGVMPFLAALLLGLATGFLTMVICLPLIMIGAALMEKTDGVSGILIGMGYIGIFLSSIILSLLVSPIVLRVGISNRFEEIMNFKWAMSMFKMMWPQMLIGSIVIGLFSVAIMLLGMAVCCVGMIPAQGYVLCMTFHLQRQWYEIFVTKGGEPIPLPAESMMK